MELMIANVYDASRQVHYSISNVDGNYEVRAHDYKNSRNVSRTFDDLVDAYKVFGKLVYWAVFSLYTDNYRMNFLEKWNGETEMAVSKEVAVVKGCNPKVDGKYLFAEYGYDGSCNLVTVINYTVAHGWNTDESSAKYSFGQNPNNGAYAWAEIPF